MPSDLLERMRRNPAGDWRIQDVEVLCREHHLMLRAGRGTSHMHVKHPSAREILTIPARRPIRSTFANSCVILRCMERFDEARIYSAY
jgi:hypothetical protein